MSIFAAQILGTQDLSPVPKEEGQASVKVIIRDLLYQDLPDSVFDNFEVYQRKIYDYVYTKYSGLVA